MLKVGNGVEASGDRNKDTVLAATFEAVIAAVYLDRGLEAVQEFVSRHMAGELARVSRDGTPPENPKSQLQELLQGHGLATPSYLETGRAGPDHNPVFRVEAVVGEQVIGRGQGGKKVEAERAAAEDALKLVLSDGFSWQSLASDTET